MSSTFNWSLTPADFGQLFAQYRQYFIVVARSYVRDQMVAEDIVSDCFLACWENREKIDLSQNIPTYILISVKRRCLNWLRDRNNRLRIQQNMYSTAQRIAQSRIGTLKTSDPNLVFAQEVAAIIEREITRMPERTRKVFVANRYEDLTYKEIAEQFGLTSGQVDYEMNKAIKILQNALKDYLLVILIMLNATRL